MLRKKYITADFQELPSKEQLCIIAFMRENSNGTVRQLIF
jgi:hypothetical protein